MVKNSEDQTTIRSFDHTNASQMSAKYNNVSVDATIKNNNRLSQLSPYKSIWSEDNQSPFKTMWSEDNQFEE
jgi:hypothetical protein